MIDNTHIYNLKAVMQEVGLGAATLRAWERRYGLLKPQRSPGGHRLYSRQDIEMLKWLVLRQKEGLSISRAVEMWKTSPKGQILPSTVELSTGLGFLSELRNQWIAACKIFDDQVANQALDQAFAIATPETICTEVLQMGLAQIGAGWYAGSSSVQQEHFASAIAIRRINSLLAAATPPTRSGSLLAACPAGEEHEFPLLLVTYLLRRGGWDVVYLGANVPLNHLDDTIQTTHPSLVLSSAQTLDSAASLRQMSEYLVIQNVPLAFGGGIFNYVPESIPCISGFYLGTDMSMVPKVIERLLTITQAHPIAKPVSLEYAQCLRKFHQNETLIINYVASEMQSSSILPAYIEIANANLTRSIASALTLGEINLLNYSVNWLEGLLENYSLPVPRAMQFYATYQKAVERYLEGDGAIIRDWLSNLQIAELAE